MQQLTPEKRVAVDRQLEPGERLYWAAPASRGMQAGALLTGCFGLPFLLFGGFPLIWAIAGIPTMFDEDNGFLHVLMFGGFGLIFVAVGVLTMTTAIGRRRDMAATVWAVTDRRLLKIVDRRGKRAIESVALRLVTGVDLYEYSDGSGTLTLTTGAPRTDRSERTGYRKGNYLITGVQDAAAARAAIQAAVDRATAA